MHLYILCMYSTQVRSAHINTAREASIPVYPNHTALLHSLKPKNPIAAENAGHGPNAMSTEYHTRFVRQRFRDKGQVFLGHAKCL